MNPGTASRLRTLLHAKPKLTYVKLNSQTPCPPRGAVLVNQAWRRRLFHSQHPDRPRSWLRPSQLYRARLFQRRSALSTAIALCLGLFTAVPCRAFYNASTGRWLSRDPIGDEQFLQRHVQKMSKAEAKRWRGASLGPCYTFLQNNPVNLVDPCGLDPTFVGCTEDQKQKISEAIQKACKDLREPRLSCCAGARERFWSSLVGVCNRMDANTITCLRDSDKKCDDACARAKISGTNMWVCDKAFTPQCGALACTILHETVHLAGGDQKTAFRYENCSREWGQCDKP